MQAPITLEEQTFRSNFSDRVTAISNVNSLFSDVEDKARRLTILKSLVGSLHLGDEIVAEIQKEIEAAEEAAKKAEEEAAAEAKENNTKSNDELDLSTEDGGEDELDLTPMPDTELKAEEKSKLRLLKFNSFICLLLYFYFLGQRESIITYINL